MKNSHHSFEYNSGFHKWFYPTLVSATLLAAMAIPASVHAGVIYDESLSGDLSNGSSVPTDLTASIGDNEVYGTTGHPAGADVDADFFRFTVPAGSELSAVIELAGTETAGPGLKSFFGVVAGSDFGATIPSTPGALLGYHLYGTGEIGTDILPSIGTGPGATGFTGPLGAGTYAFWIQEGTPGSSVSYGFNFKISAVPDAGGGFWMSFATFGLVIATGVKKRLC